MSPSIRTPLAPRLEGRGGESEVSKVKQEGEQPRDGEKSSSAGGQDCSGLQAGRGGEWKGQWAAWAGWARRGGCAREGKGGTFGYKGLDGAVLGQVDNQTSGGPFADPAFLWYPYSTRRPHEVSREYRVIHSLHLLRHQQVLQFSASAWKSEQ